jgi:hypothetical protein
MGAPDSKEELYRSCSNKVANSLSGGFGPKTVPREARAGAAL